MAQIQIWTRDVDNTEALGGVAPQHTFFIKVNDDGTREILRGGPDNDSMITGDLGVVKQEYNSSQQTDKSATYDWYDPSSGSNPLNYQGTTVKTASQAEIDTLWDSAWNKAQLINSQNYDYEPLTQNCNTVMSSMASSLGVSNEVNEFLAQKNVWTPGLNSFFTYSAADKVSDFYKELVSKVGNTAVTAVDEINDWVSNFVSTREFESSEVQSLFEESHSYTVRSNDTLYSIASLYNLTTEELIASNEWLIDENRISSDSSYALIKPGERLTIPEGATIDKNSDYYNELKSSLTSLTSEDTSELSNITDLLGSDDLKTFSEAIKSTLEEQLQQSLPSSSITDFLNTYFSEGNRNDILRGGVGNDYLDGGEGDDIIIGGAGNDNLVGGKGNDSYVYNKGDGKDIIDEKNGYDENGIYQYGGIDVIELGKGISREDVYFSTDSEGSLNIKFRGNESDQINVKNWVWDKYQIEGLKFADGTEIDLRDLHNYRFEYEGTAGDDYIYARDGSAYGNSGSNMIDGGEGNDEIYSIGGGNDLITGGAGNDKLSGGGGDDVFVYNKGDGKDSISGYGEGDVIKFGDGISKEDIYFSTDYQGSLHIKFRGNDSDQINVSGWVWNKNQIGILKFADGAEIDLRDLSSYTFEYAGTAGDDNIYAYSNSGNNMIDGGAGNDNIYSGEGNDLIIGGAGNDRLSGSVGDDVYFYNKGDGEDSIDEYRGNDVIEFGEGITKEDVYFSKVGNDYNYDLIINFKNNVSDKIIIKQQLNTSFSRQIEKLRFADGSEMDIAKESDIIFNYIGSDNSEMIESGYGKNIIEGFGGDDEIHSKISNDVIDGGSGNDRIYAGEGNDRITGGIGNDYLAGEWGDDVYVYNKGDGEDAIFDMEGRDKIILGNGIGKEEVYFSQIANGYDTNLVINFKNNVTDRINIIDWNWDSKKIETLEFADGGMLDIVEMVKNMNNNGSTSGETDSSTGEEGDVLRGSKGNDILKGGEGGDIFRGGNGEDKIKGEEGDDKIKGGGGRDVLQGGDGSDEIEGGKGNDLLRGARGDDVLKGNEGNDILEGGAGSDTLKGGKGNDILNGGWGIDRLSGGEGKDVFLFNNLSESKSDELDIILDFVQNEDKIDLSALDFDSISKWNSAATSDHHLEYHFKNGNTIIEDQHSNFAIKLAGEIQLDNNDFIF